MGRSISRVLSRVTISLGARSPALSCSLPAGCRAARIRETARSTAQDRGAKRAASEQPACCLALLRTRFTMPSPLPEKRWALTPPFHPVPPRRERRTPARSTVRGGAGSVSGIPEGECARPVCFLWHSLSPASRRPGVARRSALWSPDFPPRGCGAPARR